MSRALESITNIASDFCEDIGDSTERHHLRYQKKLLIAFKKLNLYVCPETEVEGQIIPVNGEVQHELPCNFVYETKVGVKWKGCYITLDLNKNLRLNNKKVSDSEFIRCLDGFADGSLIPGAYYPFYNMNRGGQYVGELYGMDCGFHSNQWYNIKDGVLEIGSQIPDDAEIIIEYKTNGISKDGFKLVPTEIVPYLSNKASQLFYEHTDMTKAEYFLNEANKEYYRVKRLYSYRDPEYLAFLFKSFDKAARY